MLSLLIFGSHRHRERLKPANVEGEGDNRCHVLANPSSAPSSIRSQPASLRGKTARADLGWNSPFLLIYLLTLSLVHIQGSYNETFTAQTSSNPWAADEQYLALHDKLNMSAALFVGFS